MAEQRTAQRVSSVLAVNIDGETAGWTRDVSPSGIYFETEREMEVGSELEFSIEFDGPARKLLLECTAEIVRVESSGRKLGVAAHIKEPRLGYLRQEKQQKANSTQGERI